MRAIRGDWHLVVAGLTGSALLAALLNHGRQSPAVTLALVPLVALVIGAVIVGQGAAILVLALALPISLPQLTSPLPFASGHLYPTDILVLLALASWFVSKAIPGWRGRGLTWPDTPVVGLPLALFAVATSVALLRGHWSHGATLFGQPLRLFLYAGIACSVGSLDAKRVYRILVAVLYPGTVWILLSALYYIATGTSETNQVDLSTGGSRVLAISASLYMSATLFLALLNLQLDQSARRRALHVTMVVLSLIGVGLGFGRAVFAAVALVIAVFVVLVRKIGGAVLSMLPLALPMLLLATILAVHAAPQIEHAIVSRVTSPVTSDANVQWREKANKAVWQQVKQSPLTGIGFGANASFTLLTLSSSGVLVPVTQNIGQDPHDGYLYLLSAGGAILLGAFVLLLLAYGRDCWRRLRSPLDPYERVLVIWSAATLFAFLLNAASGTEFESGPDLMTIWLLLALPGVVSRRPRQVVARGVVLTRAPVTT